MEVALLLGLAALGYALAPQIAREQKRLQREGGKKNPIETFLSPEPIADTDTVTVSKSAHGHNNMVPFFGSHVTQSMYNGATDGILDTFTGMGKHTFAHKEESAAFFKPEAGTGLPFGKQVETDFEQSRQVTSLSMKNVAPIEAAQVGPGVNDGYTNLPSGGYQQDAMREFAMPRTTDETRVVTKPKLTYVSEPVPGAHFITDVGIQPPVKKNRPDRFQVMQSDDGSLPHLNTTMGQQVASAIYPSQMMKNQNRTSTSSEYEGGAHGGFISYIRAFTEPYQEFMKLTVEGRPPPAGPSGATAALSAGAQSYNVQTHRDESLLKNTREFESPLMSFGGQAPTTDHMGSVKRFEPLQEDIYTQRNNSSLLDAFKKNPYTQSLQSTA